MAFDPTKYLSEYGVSAVLEMVVSAAYEQGVNDGIARVLQAAQSAVAPHVNSPTKPPQTANVADAGDSAEPSTKRVPRGLVQSVLSDTLAANPGLSISDYERLVLSAEPEISVKSVGNDLRRGEGTRYKRDRPGGTKWYLFYQEIEEAVSRTAAAAPSMFPNQEGGDGHDPATT